MLCKYTCFTNKTIVCFFKANTFTMLTSVTALSWLLHSKDFHPFNLVVTETYYLLSLNSFMSD